MEVTKSNFESVLPKVKESVEKASFVAIDCEFSGLNTISNINAYDTQIKYYEKIRGHCKDFLLLQFGLCAFRWQSDKNRFEQNAYNFYIFRRPINRNVPDVRFLCQTSSIDFLITQGFDFNKLFKEGIPYLNSKEEEKYRENLSEQQKLRAQHALNQDSPNRIAIPPEDAPFVNSVMDQIRSFLSTDDKEVFLPRCNSFLRRLIFQTVQEKLGDKVFLEFRQIEGEKDRVFVASRPKSKEILKAEEEERVKRENRELEDLIGFSKVIKILVESNKLIVGHNMVLDLLHTIDKFLMPLPEDYDEFKESTHHFFPNILDTKYMSSIAPFKELIQSNVLGHMFKTLSEKPFEMPEIDVGDGFKGYLLEDEKEHEAGYDAFITGLSFIAMYNYLYKTAKTDKEYLDFGILGSYINRLYLMRLQDYPCINLAAPDSIPSRDHVLYITFPKEWRMNDIVQLFSPFGNVHIAWINDVSAYVGLVKREQASIALSTLSQSDRYSVMTYAQRQTILSNKTTFSSPVTMKYARKRGAEQNYSNNKSDEPSMKRKRPNRSREMRRSFETIPEENEETVSTPKKNSAATKKTFDESADWD